jgi:hypothetical protein
MATRLYGVSRGDGPEAISETAGPAVTKELELIVDLAPGMTREDVLLLLERLSRHLLEHDWPPA